MRISPESDLLSLRSAVKGDELRHLTLGVERSSLKKGDFALEHFVEALQKARIFKEVFFLPSEKSPDLLLSSFIHDYPPIGQGFQCFEPYLLVATAGLVPAICEGTHSLSFQLQERAGIRKIVVREGFIQKSVEGWAAVALNASPEWKREGAYEDFLALLFLSKRTEILGLASSNSSWVRTPVGAAQF